MRVLELRLRLVLLLGRKAWVSMVDTADLVA